MTDHAITAVTDATIAAMVMAERIHSWSMLSDCNHHIYRSVTIPGIFEAAAMAENKIIPATVAEPASVSCVVPPLHAIAIAVACRDFSMASWASCRGQEIWGNSGNSQRESWKISPAFQCFEPYRDLQGLSGTQEHRGSKCLVLEAILEDIEVV